MITTELTGISIYFYDGRIRFHKGSMQDLGQPPYIHLFLNKEDKKLLIRGSEVRDNNAFKVSYRKTNGEWRYQINCLQFVKHLAGIIGVEYPSESLLFDGVLLNDKKTVLVDLSKYTKIPYNN